MATDLPQELIDKILDESVTQWEDILLPDYRTLRALSLTSRFFTPSCQARLFQDINLIRKSCKQFRDLLSDSPHLGPYVSSLRMYYHSVSPIVVDVLLRLPDLQKLNVDRTCLVSIAEHMHTSLQSVRVFTLIGAQLPNVSTLPTVISLLPNVETLKLKGVGLENVKPIPFLIPKNRKIPSPSTIFLGVADTRTLSGLSRNLAGPNPAAKLDKVKTLQIRISCMSVRDRWDIEPLLVLTQPSLQNLTLVMPEHSFPPPMDFSRHSHLKSLCLRLPLNAFEAPSESYPQTLPDSLATLPQTTLLVLLSLTQHTNDIIVQDNSQWLALNNVFIQHNQTFLHIILEMEAARLTAEIAVAERLALTFIAQCVTVREEGRLLVNAPSLGNSTLTEFSPFGAILSDS
ncbi:uncharacterized protein EV420DRAFT_1581803 [Desarmillaria tabescens]|uniref:Uncharacterized protein n=1 Tax=Armillaria tabescens TaxID=1929756 RepID=A0AA39JE64_ARMTA|nr:uncharacterized protein EV420DRAFT_1581803 [Desarmillaria tabescens]KAK0440412.1 hypothetical protein EV420DRAFT_1581803 [Desarmillaria tabescens]